MLSDLFSVNDLMAIVGEAFRHILNRFAIVNGNLEELTELHGFQTDFRLNVVKRAGNTLEIEAIRDFLNGFRLPGPPWFPCGS